MAKKDLEETIKEKVAPLVEESMEKSWGLTIPKIEDDITDQLSNPHFEIYIPLNKTFKDAKNSFKKEFLKREIRFHQGNVSALAKNLEIDRRSVHRVIKDLDIDIEKLREDIKTPLQEEEEIIDIKIRHTLDQYKGIITTQKMQKMYEEIPHLSRNIAKLLPHKKVTWKKAESDFEREFLRHALKRHNWKISKTAKDIEIRSETLHRKIKRLSIGREF